MKRQVFISTILAALIVLLLVILYFTRRTETYGCVIQFIDANDMTRVFTVRGQCRNDSSITERNRWFEYAPYDMDTSNTKDAKIE